MICSQRTRSLIECLTKSDKFELAECTSQLMPNGIPDFRSIRLSQPLVKLFDEYGRKDMRMVVFLMVKGFCESLNVVRNMTEDQMIETAAFLIDECGDMRLEDYQIMFTMAKRGQLIKIMDRLDIDTVGKIYDAYYQYRAEQGRKIQEEEYEAYERYLRLNTPVSAPSNNYSEQEAEARWGKLVGVMTAWQGEIDEEKDKESEEKRRRDIEAYARLQQVDIDKIREEFKGVRLENPKKKL